ncbi:Hypothetical protein FKW44_001285, partial [Caligus rogercresseyi]
AAPSVVDAEAVEGALVSSEALAEVAAAPEDDALSWESAVVDSAAEAMWAGIK